MLEQASDAVESRESTVMSALAAAVWCAWFAPGGLGAHDVRLVMHVHGVHGLGHEAPVRVCESICNAAALVYCVPVR